MPPLNFMILINSRKSPIKWGPRYSGFTVCCTEKPVFKANILRNCSVIRWCPLIAVSLEDRFYCMLGKFTALDFLLYFRLGLPDMVSQGDWLYKVLIFCYNSSRITRYYELEILVKKVLIFCYILSRVTRFCQSGRLAM